MKQARLLFALLVLVAAEAFLPAQWQSAISDRLLHGNPQYDYSVITHPAIDQEIEQVIHEHVGLQVALYAFFVVLLAANSVLLVRAWNAMRRIRL